MPITSAQKEKKVKARKYNEPRFFLAKVNICKNKGTSLRNIDM
jgi:hypothetical protein